MASYELPISDGFELLDTLLEIRSTFVNMRFICAIEANSPILKIAGESVHLKKKNDKNKNKERHIEKTEKTILDMKQRLQAAIEKRTSYAPDFSDHTLLCVCEKGMQDRKPLRSSILI